MAMTNQEKHWASTFGDHYNARCTSCPEELAKRLIILGRALERAATPRSALEAGAGEGINLVALSMLAPGISLTGVEVNKAAFETLDSLPGVQAVHAGFSEFDTDSRFDLVLTSGFLIHVAPENLPATYEKLHRLSSRYIFMIEYFNPVPVPLVYHEKENMLWKRDFAGEMLDMFSDLRLLDYGFLYSRDRMRFGDSNWFLLEKHSA